MMTIIIKGTNGCNLACSYCSLGEKKDFKYVDRQMLEEIFLYSCQLAQQQKENALNFILHGGEPALVDWRVYKSAIDKARKQFADMEIRISMQSNGLALTDEMIRFIQDYDIHIGISLDGSEEIHDAQRLTAGCEPTYRQIVDNIKRFHNAGIAVSCLMVLTKNALGKGYEYLKFFEENGIPLKINPLLNYGGVYEHPELSLSQGDYADYLIGLYEYLIEKDVGVQIAPIDDILQSVLNHQRLRECTFNKECSRHFLCIDYKGDIYPCGKFSDMDRFKLANITKVPDNIFDTQIMQSLRKRRNEKLPSKCQSCKYLKFCNGGCSAQAVIDGNFDDTPILCEDYRKLFRYFSKDGLILLKGELQRQKKILEAAQ